MCIVVDMYVPGYELNSKTLFLFFIYFILFLHFFPQQETYAETLASKTDLKSTTELL